MPITFLWCKRRGEAMSLSALGLLVLGYGAGCALGSERRQVEPIYDGFSRKLVALYADQDADGRIDQWTYTDGNRVFRGEKDTDGNGQIDRWEYFRADASLERVGTSSQNDGIEDTWTWPADAGGVGRIDLARHRDRQVDRTEFYRADVLIRTTEDTNADGRIDRWDTYEAGVLRQAAFDTTLTSDRPNRRIVYGQSGRFERLETDPERDGTFVEIAGASEPDLRRVRP